MIVLVGILALALALALAGLAAVRLLHRARRSSPPAARSSRRILFPFVAEDLSQRALDAALRLAAAESATLVPVFLARVSLDLPLDAPLPHQCSMAVPLLEAIEQRAAEAGVPVDSRIALGRNPRHALREAIATERFDRIVTAAAANGDPGFDADDIAWLLEHAPGEIVVLRPGMSEGRRRPTERQTSSRPFSRANEMAGSR
ncbi:MAG: universal stress protein [Solirubrobacteraceae bacterium]